MANNEFDGRGNAGFSAIALPDTPEVKFRKKCFAIDRVRRAFDRDKKAFTFGMVSVFGISGGLIKMLRFEPGEPWGLPLLVMCAAGVVAITGMLGFVKSFK